MNQIPELSEFHPITLPVQMGGVDADEAVGAHLIELHRLLAKHCRGPYSDEVDEFALIFRIDGAIQKFGAEGCERLRRSYKERYITVDICVPESRWRSVPVERLRKYLSAFVRKALELCIQRLQRDGTRADAEKLFSDYERVEGLFHIPAPPSGGLTASLRHRPPT